MSCPPAWRPRTSALPRSGSWGSGSGTSSSEVQRSHVSFPPLRSRWEGGQTVSPCGLPPALQERLGRQQRDMEEERSRLQEVIGKMEARLSEQSRLLEQVGLPSGTGPCSPDHPREYSDPGLWTSLCSLSRPFLPLLPPAPPAEVPSPATAESLSAHQLAARPTVLPATRTCHGS